MRRLTSVTIICLSLSCSPTVHSADVAEEGKAIIRSMHTARQMIRSGVVQIRGIRDAYNPERSPPRRQYPVDADIAFDWPAGRLRYDAKKTQRAASWNIEELEEVDDLSELMEQREAEEITSRLWSILTPEMYVYYERETTPDEPYKARSDIEIFNADTNSAGPLVQSFHCFDVRSVGLFNFWELIGSTGVMGYELPEVRFHMCDLDIAIEELLKWEVVGIERDGDLTTLRFLSDMTITLNESQGFTPLSHHHYRGLPDSDHVDSTVIATIKWKQINDVWVPSEFMIGILDASCEGSDLRHTYTMEWSHVNQPIPDHYFDYTTFPDIAEETLVHDYRSGEQVRIAKWSGGEFVAIEPPTTMVPPVLTDPPEPGGPRLLLINSAILVLLLGGTLAFRLLRRQSV